MVQWCDAVIAVWLILLLLPTSSVFLSPPQLCAVEGDNSSQIDPHSSLYPS